MHSQRYTIWLDHQEFTRVGQLLGYSSELPDEYCGDQCSYYCSLLSIRASFSQD
jgi:hypothetical protein